MPSFARPDREVDLFDDDPVASFTLAARYYTDPDVFDAERSAVFHRSWIYVAHGSELVENRSYVTAEVLGQRIFVVRNDAGKLRAFFNVCLHRGHSLLEGTGTLGRLIACPYHGWAYNADGTLQGARMSEQMEGFDADDYALPEVAVEDFCGLIFVNLDPDPAPMDEVYPGARQAIEDLSDDVSGLLPSAVSVFDIAANWKNVGDNLLECYHCHTAHKGFVDLIDMATYRNETFDNWSIQSGQRRADNETYEIDATDGGKDSFTSIFLWPNVSIGNVPGQRGLLIFHFEPIAPEQTKQTLTVLSPNGDQTESERKAFEFFETVLGPEDVALVEDVQVGLNSLGYHQGKFICIPDRPEISEHAVHHFHQMVRASLDVTG